MKEDRMKYENEAEEYSQGNNIKITSLEDTHKKNDTALETAQKVITMLKENDLSGNTWRSL